jgi:hypothetical protein
MPKRRKRRKAKPELPTGPGTACRTNDSGNTYSLNTDNSLIPSAEPGDVYINRQLWEGWLREFDNHVVFGEGTGTLHRFYDNAPNRTSEEMAQPGVVAPFGEPRVEIQGQVYVDTEVSTSLINAGDGTTVQLTNIMLASPVAQAGDVTNVQCVTSSAMSPANTQWVALRDFITQNPDQAPTTQNEIQQWLGWETLGCRHTRHFGFPLGSGAALPRHESPLYRRARMERKNRRNTAELRAEQLLWNVLDRPQRRDWRRHGHFFIQVGPRRYRIQVKKRSGNVQLVSLTGKVLKSYCCHTRERIPNADNALAQMMMLHHDEAGFLKLANVHWNVNRDGHYHTFADYRGVGAAA